MVTVHRVFGFRFVMFINDHAPPHFHVFGHGGEAKMELAAGRAVTVVWVNGIARGDLRRLVAEARDQHSMLLNAWRVIHE
jgi:Domain of unknown function (DUF4160)